MLIKYLKIPISRLYSLTGIYTVSMLWFNVIDDNIETSNELFEIEEGKSKFQIVINIVKDLPKIYTNIKTTVLVSGL